MAGFTSVDNVHATQLAVITLLQCQAGKIGITAGAARDTSLFGVYIVLNGTAVNVLIGGLLDTNGAAANLSITGVTTQDYFWMPPAPILNENGAFTFQASVAAKVWVFTKAYIGP